MKRWAELGPLNRMCDTCLSILGSNAKPHPGQPCVIAKTLYCSLCAVYGHSYKKCAEVELKRFRETAPKQPYRPEPINIPQPTGRENWVEVGEEEDGKCVRAMLKANNIDPMSCQEKGRSTKKDVKENTKRLAEFLKSRGKMLVMVKPIIPAEIIRSSH